MAAFALAVVVMGCSRTGSSLSTPAALALPALRDSYVTFAAWDESATELRLCRQSCEEGACRSTVDLLSAGRLIHSLAVTGVFPDGPIKPGAFQRSWLFEGTVQTLARNLAAGAALFSSKEVHLGTTARAFYLSHTWVHPAEGLPVTIHRVFLVNPLQVALVFEVRDSGYEGQGTVEVRDADNDGIDEILLSNGSFDMPGYSGKLTLHWDQRQMRFTAR